MLLSIIGQMGIFPKYIGLNITQTLCFYLSITGKLLLLPLSPIQPTIILSLYICQFRVLNFVLTILAEIVFLHIKSDILIIWLNKCSHFWLFWHIPIAVDTVVPIFKNVRHYFTVKLFLLLNIWHWFSFSLCMQEKLPGH